MIITEVIPMSHRVVIVGAYVQQGSEMWINASAVLADFPRTALKTFQDHLIFVTALPAFGAHRACRRSIA